MTEQRDRPGQREEIGRVVDAAYAALAFDPGSQPDWNSFAAVFDDRALLALRVFPEDDLASVMDLREYAESQMRHELGAQGYSETPGARVIDMVGDVASVRQEFSMNFADRTVEAVDFFLLVRRQHGWRIVSVASDMDCTDIVRQSCG